MTIRKTVPETRREAVKRRFVNPQQVIVNSKMIITAETQKTSID